MSSGDIHADGPVERIDADAVCIECGAVNPEGTLLCKTCGNNLRDQRNLRFGAEAVAEGMAAVGERPAWLTSGFAILGILVVLCVAINAGRIVDVMMDVQSPDTSDIEDFWSGPRSAVFDKLAEELQYNPISVEESELAMEQPDVSGVYEGRYVLLRPEAAFRRIMGQAHVRQSGEKLQFVALLDRGQVELRGEARLEGENRIAARDSAGILKRDEYYAADGFAQPMETGGYECFGLSEYDTGSYSVLAFRVPDGAEVQDETEQP